MATTLLRFFATPSTVSFPAPKRIRHRGLPAHPQPQRLSSLRHRLLLPRAYKVTIEHEGETRTLDVGEDETILGRALEEGLAVPHDCKLGVCMTCPATLLRFFATPSTVSFPAPKRIRHRGLPAHPQPQRLSSLRHRLLLPRAYKVTIEHEGETRTLDVGEDETILGRALEEGLAVPHDCKLGVCMTCPARLLSGAVDQSEGMLSDDVIERGYTLLCVSYPRTDCQIRTIPEEELLSLQLATAND